ncbi:MAG: hypothetical protein HC859_04655 [Bacteroidia bacterium]|nr:hypothetical protein [Bacteroidia bacterium]
MKLPSLKSSYAIASLAVFMFSLLSPKWVLAPAAWLGPPLLLLLVHRLKPGRSLLAGIGVIWLANLIAGYGVMPFPTLVFVVMALVGAVIKTVPYMIHRLVAPHMSCPRGWSYFRLRLSW